MVLFGVARSLYKEIKVIYPLEIIYQNNAFLFLKCALHPFTEQYMIIDY